MSTVRARDMNIHYGPARSRTIVRERLDHSVVVSNRYGHGYIERPYRYRNAAFVRRTYYMNGVAYSRIYQPYRLGGVPLYVYAPGYYYPAPLYSWAYQPWGVPVAYGWGWAGQPWYGYYGGYFTPYPVYTSASLWLTDYTLAQTLQAAYAERAAELANDQTYSAPLPPEVKQQIADEVNRQIALESSEAASGSQAAPDPGSSGIERMLADGKSHAFVVSSQMYLQSSVGECYVTEGDVLGLMGGAQPDLSNANLIVLARKGNSCPKGSTVRVGIADLQDMQNHMRETIDQGLGELQKLQGQNGIPPAPAGAAQPPEPTVYAEIAPPPDPNVATELNTQNKEADQALQETFSQSAGGGANTEPVDRSVSKQRVAQGQTINEVLAIAGEPVDTYDSGAEKTYVFSNMIVTFTGGRVSKIQE
jgi:hypothetical protein